jgi:hypothetical protein
LPVTQIHRPARLATRAASFRYAGRHHPGIPGGFIPFYPGDFIGIRTPGNKNAIGNPGNWYPRGNFITRQLVSQLLADPAYGAAEQGQLR